MKPMTMGLGPNDEVVYIDMDGHRFIRETPLTKAAGEMLAALLGIDEIFDGGAPMLELYKAEIADCRAAIAKAKGEQP